MVELKLLEEKPARGPLPDLAIAPRDLRMCNCRCEAVEEVTEVNSRCTIEQIR